ncbi:FAD:protein FMN transferase [Cellulomonas sp. URHD0024]|uniref:FAD:protein FMN transferase n=1 Tax=Cellulomonas sp. URHD0024 TaxID=1302620 RepID=UPI00041B5947|nr:FAD:protein FMN transferase [Cellulomonas sp. URHD0024]
MRTPDASFDAIGTRWSIYLDGPLDVVTLRRVRDRIDAYDAVWSRFRADSLVSLMAREAGTYRLPAEAGPLLDLYALLGRVTDGAVSPLVGRSLVRLGYDADYSLRPSGAPEAAPAWDAVLERDGDVLVVREPVLLDVGAAGKGQLVDLVAAELRACGIEQYVVDAGGDLVHRGGEAFRVALQQPGDATRAVGVVELADAALCGSAVDRRAWGDGLHHVLDARTGMPTKRVAATWVVAPCAMVADGLATAHFFADADLLEAAIPHTYARLGSDGRLRYSLGLQGEVFA